MLLLLGAVLEDLFKFSKMTLSVLADELKTAVLSPHSLYTHSHRLYHWTASSLRMAFAI